MPRATSSKPKILIVLHQENSSPGRVGHMLIEEGFELDVRRPPLGDALPDAGRPCRHGGVRRTDERQ
ncbi:hypothetical protein ACVILI_000624 [Mesorhizobium sp. USDA 4775]